MFAVLLCAFCGMLDSNDIHVNNLEENMIKNVMVVMASLCFGLVACDKQTPTQKNTTGAIKKTVKVAQSVQYFEPMVGHRKTDRGDQKANRDQPDYGQSDKQGDMG